MARDIPRRDNMGTGKPVQLRCAGEMLRPPAVPSFEPRELTEIMKKDGFARKMGRLQRVARWGSQAAEDKNDITLCPQRTADVSPIVKMSFNTETQSTDSSGHTAEGSPPKGRKGNVSRARYSTPTK